MSPSSTNSELWTRRYRGADPGALPLVCFPHAGGSATAYAPLARAVPPFLDVVAVQYPGRQERLREPCVDQVPLLAEQIGAALGPLAGGPLVLFGHSMGAVLAFEVARRLPAPPGALFVSGRRAPSRTRVETVHLRDDAGLVAELQRLSGTDARILEDEEVLRMVLPAVRSDYRAIEMYRYREGPPLTCPIVALYGDADPRVTSDEVEAWASHTVGGFRAHRFPGGHFYLSARLPEVVDVIVDSLTGFGLTGGDGAG
jgi:surfactin synthase thioesterase subunit